MLCLANLYLDQKRRGAAGLVSTVEMLRQCDWEFQASCQYVYCKLVCVRVDSSDLRGGDSCRNISALCTSAGSDVAPVF